MLFFSQSFDDGSISRHSFDMIYSPNLDLLDLLFLTALDPSSFMQFRFLIPTSLLISYIP
jgi:hypothetical protein